MTLTILEFLAAVVAVNFLGHVHLVRRHNYNQVEAVQADTLQALEETRQVIAVKGVLYCVKNKRVWLCARFLLKVVLQVEMFLLNAKFLVSHASIDSPVPRSS